MPITTPRTTVFFTTLGCSGRDLFKPDASLSTQPKCQSKTKQINGGGIREKAQIPAGGWKFSKEKRGQQCEILRHTSSTSRNPPSYHCHRFCFDVDVSSNNEQKMV